MSYFCNDCNLKPFSSQSSLTTHRNAVHGPFDLRVQTYPMDVFDHKCLDGCEVSFPTIKDLRQHLARNHKILTGQEIFEFDEKNEFLTWMENLNRDPHRRYIKASEMKDNEYLTVTHYNCKPAPSTKTEQKQQSNKSCVILDEVIVTPSCTSQILVVDNFKTNLIVVTFFKNHYGHKKDMGHLENPVNYVSRKSLKLTTTLPERIADEATVFTIGTKKRKKRTGKLPKGAQRKKKSIPTVLEESAQDSDDMYSDDHVYCKLNTDPLVSYDASVCEPEGVNDRIIINTAKSVYSKITISEPNGVNSRKTKLKKDIIGLIQELSENNFELYDENTLCQVKNTLNECCCFLDSYELAAEKESVSEDSDDNTPFRISTSPPKLVWFPQKKD